MEKLAENIFVYRDVLGGIDRVIYLLKGDKNILIDAGLLIDEKVDVVVLTHCHVDHVEFAKHYQKKGAKILIGEKDVKYMEEMGEIAGLQLSTIPEEEIKCKVNGLLKENMIVENSNFKLKVIDTPGHTPGGIALYDKEKEILFSGDTWFGGETIGAIFPGGDYETELESVKKLKELKVDLLCPGH